MFEPLIAVGWSRLQYLDFRHTTINILIKCQKILIEKLFPNSVKLYVKRVCKV